jgi:hypothetical protein
MNLIARRGLIPTVQQRSGVGDGRMTSMSTRSSPALLQDWSSRHRFQVLNVGTIRGPVVAREGTAIAHSNHRTFLFQSFTITVLFPLLAWLWDRLGGLFGCSRSPSINSGKRSDASATLPPIGHSVLFPPFGTECYHSNCREGVSAA